MKRVQVVIGTRAAVNGGDNRLNIGYFLAAENVLRSVLDYFYMGQFHFNNNNVCMF